MSDVDEQSDVDESSSSHHEEEHVEEKAEVASDDDDDNNNDNNDDDEEMPDSGDDEHAAVASSSSSSSRPVERKKKRKDKYVSEAETLKSSEPKKKAVRKSRAKKVKSVDDGEGEDESKQSPATTDEVKIKQPRKKKVKRISTYVSKDSDSESDYKSESDHDSDDDDDDDDDDDNDDGRVHHEVQVDNDEDVVGRTVGSVGTRGTVHVDNAATFVTAPAFTGMYPPVDNKSHPHMYSSLSIVGRLRMDIKDGEIDQVKKRKRRDANGDDVLKLGNIKISSIARDVLRVAYFAIYRRVIHIALTVERGKKNKQPKSIPDDAIIEALDTMMRHPMG